ncbi:MAG: PaaI family thioesterase [Rhodospirillales bacterium]|nr:PaaI family thioesterase [Rhodospirillales bacterium]
MPAPDPDFARKVADSFARQGAMAHLGAELTRVEPGAVEIRLPFRSEVAQQHGFFHGGVVATIGDSAGGYAGYSLMPAGSSVLTVEYKINMVAPAKGEALVARGKVVKAGRTLTVCTVEVFALDRGRETLCSVMQQTLICLADRPDGPEKK